MLENKFIKRIASSLVALGISTIAYSNSWAENLKNCVAGPYTGEMSNYGISAKNGVTLAIKHINAAGGFWVQILRLFRKTMLVIQLRPLE